MTGFATVFLRQRSKGSMEIVVSGSHDFVCTGFAFDRQERKAYLCEQFGRADTDDVPLFKCHSNSFDFVRVGSPNASVHRTSLACAHCESRSRFPSLEASANLLCPMGCFKQLACALDLPGGFCADDS